MFLGLGYEVVDGREVETTSTTSTSSTFPEWHPARSPRATFFLDGDARPAHARRRPRRSAIMEEREPPIYMVSLGRCLPARHDRRDALPDLPPGRGPRGRPGDHARRPQGHARSTSCARSSAPSGACASARTTSRSPSRRSSPTSRAPSAAATGCRVCKHSGWIEMGGSGMVDPAVFGYVGYDPEEWSRLRVRPRPRADRAAPPRPPGHPPALGERPPRPRGSSDAGPALLAARVRRARRAARASSPSGSASRRRGERDRAARRRRTRTATSASSSSAGWSRPASTRTPTGSSSAASTWGRASRARSSAAPGTSAPARRSRSRCPGAVLPGAEAAARAGEAARRGLRGMILSERELELGADHTGILVLPEREPGTPLADVLPLAETVLEVEATGNRPDLLSSTGSRARWRRSSALELAPPPGRRPRARRRRAGRRRDRGSRRAARATSAALFRDVRIGPSPPWLRARLTAAGMRPISNVVDVTNYVMLALGNPLHAFDRTHARRGPDRRPPRAARREDPHARRRRPRARRARPGDRRRRAGGRDRRDHGRRGDRGHARRRPTSCSRRRTSSRSGSCAAPSGSSCAPRARTAGRRASTRTSPPQAAALATQLIVELAGARWVGRHRRPRRAAGAAGRPLPARSAPTRSIGLETPPEEQRRDPRAARLRRRRRTGT